MGFICFLKIVILSEHNAYKWLTAPKTGALTIIYKTDKALLRLTANIHLPWSIEAIVLHLLQTDSSGVRRSELVSILFPCRMRLKMHAAKLFSVCKFEAELYSPSLHRSCHLSYLFTKYLQTVAVLVCLPHTLLAFYESQFILPSC